MLDSVVQFCTIMYLLIADYAVQLAEVTVAEAAGVAIRQLAACQLRQHVARRWINTADVVSTMYMYVCL